MIERLRSLLFSREGRQMLSTYAAEGLAVVGMVLAYRFAAHLGKPSFDGYVIVRRTVSFIYPLLLIGAAVGLTRFVALNTDRTIQRKYLYGALSWVLPMGALLLVIGSAFPAGLSWLVFGDESNAAIIPPLSLMIFGVSLHGVAYSYQRGLHNIHVANMLQVLVLALGPCLAFVFMKDLRSILWCTGIVWVIAASLALLPGLLGGPVGPVKKQRAELLRFGLPRVPGDLAFGALLTVPVYLAARAQGSDVGGEVGFGTTLLNLAAAVFSPVALMLLPATAAQLASGDHSGLADRIGRLSRMMILAGTALMIVFELLADPLLHIYLGDTATDYIFMSRLVFIGAAPFAYFIGLRSVLDAYYHTPRNGINLTVAFLILMVGGVVHLTITTPPWTVGAALLVALYYLGWATWRDVRFVRSELERKANAPMDSLRILVVIPAPENSLAFPFSRRQALALAERHGAHVTFFHLESRTSIAKLLRSRGRFKKLLREARPDVVHVHYGSVTALFTVLSSSVPVVITFLGSDLNHTPSDGFLRDLLGRTFSQIAAFFAAGIVCVSENLRERLWWRSDEARVFALGVDLDHFKPKDKQACRKALGWDPAEQVIIFNANNPAVKRLDIAEEVLHRVQLAGIQARLHKVEGRVPYEQMPELLNAADVMLLCSNSEGSPSMVKEAMGCLLPVVCNDVGDTALRLKDVTPGAVVTQDAGALADAVVQVLRSGGRSNGRDLAEQNGIDAFAIDRELLVFLRSVTIHA